MIKINGAILTKEEELSYYKDELKGYANIISTSDYRAGASAMDSCRRTKKIIQSIESELKIEKLLEKQKTVRQSSAYDRIDKQIQKLRATL